jgi:ABC-type dipeptide/oligopeptide/nickel transport system ATPase component
MPKAPKASKLNRVARRVAAAAPIPVKEHKNDEDPGTEESQILSRGQRKRLAKREQFLRREKLVLSSLKLKSQEEQKRRIDGLDAIKEALMNTTKTQTPEGTDDDPHTNHYTTNNAKKALVASELEHMSLVMQHPAFKANPFETMQEHLRNTFAGDRKKMERQAKERNILEKKEAEEKARQKKERLQGIKKKPKKRFKNRTKS